MVIAIVQLKRKFQFVLVYKKKGGRQIYFYFWHTSVHSINIFEYVSVNTVKNVNDIKEMGIICQPQNETEENAVS